MFQRLCLDLTNLLFLKIPRLPIFQNNFWLPQIFSMDLLYEWTALSRQFFRHGLTSVFIVKGERFYDYFSVTIILEKISNFLVTATPLTPSPHARICIPFSESHSF